MVGLAPDAPAVPALTAPVPLELLGDIPTDFSVREAVQKRQLLLESMPGAPAALAVVAIGGRMAS